MNDELLKELINEDVLQFDENALAEKVLFIYNFTVEYDDNSTVLSVILQKKIEMSTFVFLELCCVVKDLKNIYRSLETSRVHVLLPSFSFSERK